MDFEEDQLLHRLRQLVHEHSNDIVDCDSDQNENDLMNLIHNSSYNNNGTNFSPIIEIEKRNPLVQTNYHKKFSKDRNPSCDEKPIKVLNEYQWDRLCSHLYDSRLTKEKSIMKLKLDLLKVEQKNLTFTPVLAPVPANLMNLFSHSTVQERAESSLKLKEHKIIRMQAAQLAKERKECPFTPHLYRRSKNILQATGTKRHPYTSSNGRDDILALLPSFPRTMSHHRQSGSPYRHYRSASPRDRLRPPNQWKHPGAAIGSRNVNNNDSGDQVMDYDSDGYWSDSSSASYDRFENPYATGNGNCNGNFESKVDPLSGNRHKAPPPPPSLEPHTASRNIVSIHDIINNHLCDRTASVPDSHRINDGNSDSGSSEDDEDPPPPPPPLSPATRDYLLQQQTTACTPPSPNPMTCSTSSTASNSILASQQASPPISPHTYLEDNNTQDGIVDGNLSYPLNHYVVDDSQSSPHIWKEKQTPKMSQNQSYKLHNKKVPKSIPVISYEDYKHRSSGDNYKSNENNTCNNSNSNDNNTCNNSRNNDGNNNESNISQRKKQLLLLKRSVNNNNSNNNPFPRPTSTAATATASEKALCDALPPSDSPTAEGGLHDRTGDVMSRVPPTLGDVPLTPASTAMQDRYRHRHSYRSHSPNYAKPTKSSLAAPAPTPHDVTNISQSEIDGVRKNKHRIKTLSARILSSTPSPHHKLKLSSDDRSTSGAPLTLGCDLHRKHDFITVSISSNPQFESCWSTLINASPLHTSTTNELT